MSLPLQAAGISTLKSFWYGQLSGMVEPLAGVLGAAGVTFAEPVLPYALAFAAGAMIYVVIDDIVPEAHQRSVVFLSRISTAIRNVRIRKSLFLSLPRIPISLSGSDVLPFETRGEKRNSASRTYREDRGTHVRRMFENDYGTMARDGSSVVSEASAKRTWRISFPGSAA